MFEQSHVPGYFQEGKRFLMQSLEVWLPSLMRKNTSQEQSEDTGEDSQEWEDIEDEDEDILQVSAKMNGLVFSTSSPFVLYTYCHPLLPAFFSANHTSTKPSANLM